MAGLDMAVRVDAGNAGPDERVADLVASEVIPRLLLTCRANADARRPSETHIDTLARLAVARDGRAAEAHVGALRDTGVPVETLLNDLIGPAANRLGDFWSCDSSDFAEVAIGASRLVQIARALGVEVERALPLDAPRALIASPESERHGLGGLIVVQSFRAAGWRVTALPGASDDSIAEEAAGDLYDMIGLSIGAARTAPRLPALVARLRAASAKPDALIALGGPALACEPGLADHAGADFIARDAREALARVRTLLPCARRAAH